MFKKTLLLIILIAGLGIPIKAQHVSLSTNMVDWACLGTANLSAGVSVSRHFSLDAGVRYNPFEINRSSGLTIANKKTSAYAGVRYWPWYVYSGWWVEGKARWSDFYNTGIWRLAVDEGTAVGGGLSAGYTWLISKHINIDFGMGAWGGKLLEHNRYHCLNCMELRESGSKNFIALDDVSISLMIMF